MTPLNIVLFVTLKVQLSEDYYVEKILAFHILN